MKKLDFIHKYKNSLPTNLRSQFERDLLSVFIDEEVTRRVLSSLDKSPEEDLFKRWELFKNKQLKDHFEQIMDIETNKLKYE